MDARLQAAVRPGETLRTAIRDVTRRPLRNGLALLGVLLATALAVALFSLEAGVRRSLAERVLERQLSGFVQVTPATPRAGEAPRPLDAAAVSALGRIKGVREAIPIVVVPASLRVAERGPSGTVMGMTPFGGAPYALAAGRAPRTDEADAVVLTGLGASGLGLDAGAAIGRQVSLELQRGAGATLARTGDRSDDPADGPRWPSRGRPDAADDPPRASGRAPGRRRGAAPLDRERRAVGRRGLAGDPRREQ